MIPLALTIEAFRKIVPKPWMHSSPSQIKTVRRCQRKWWFEKIAGLGSTTTPQAELGTRVHAVLEHYLKKLLPPGTGPLWEEAEKIAQYGYSMIPLPGSIPPAQIERNFRIPTGIVDVIGRIDLIVEGAQAPWRITDYKTIGDLKYALTDEQLRMDVQCAVYLKDLTQVVPDTKKAEFAHYYFQTGAPGKRQVIALVSRDETEERWAGILDTVRNQKELSVVTDSTAIPGNPQACNDYGGCPFKGACDVGKKMFNFSVAKTPIGISLTKDTLPMSPIVTSLTESDRHALIEKLVAAGHQREVISKINDSALQNFAAQIADPVNPGNKHAAPVATPTTTDDTPEKMHWKKARARLAELRGITFEELSNQIKAADWKADDVLAEIRRLEQGLPPAPLVPKATAPEPTKPPATDTMVMVAIVNGKNHPITIGDDFAEIPDLGIKIGTTSGSSLAFKLQALKDRIFAKLNAKAMFDQVSVSTTPKPPSTPPKPFNPLAAPAASAKTTEEKPHLSLRADLGGPEKVMVHFYPGDVVKWGSKSMKLPAGTTPAMAIKLIFAEEQKTTTVSLPPAPIPVPDRVVITSEFPTTSSSPFATTAPATPDAIVTKEEASSSPFAGTPVKTSDVISKTIIYMDCIPSWEHTRLDAILEPFAKQVEAENGVFYYGVVPFGKGPSMVAALLLKAIVTGELTLPEHIALNSFLPASLPAFEVLCRFAKGVVRAGK